MDLTYKIIIAVFAGLLVFYIMKTMTKWVFRLIVIGLVIAAAFYGAISNDDIKGIFSKEPVAQAEEPVAQAEEPVAQEPDNATTSLTEQALQ